MGFWGYYERATPKRRTCQNLAFQGTLSLRYQSSSDDSIQIVLNLTQFITLGTESNLEGFVWSYQSKTGLVSLKQFAPQCYFLASRPFRCCSFKICLSKCPFYGRLSH